MSSSSSGFVTVLDGELRVVVDTGFAVRVLGFNLHLRQMKAMFDRSASLKVLKPAQIAWAQAEHLSHWTELGCDELLRHSQHVHLVFSSIFNRKVVDCRQDEIGYFANLAWPTCPDGA
jgi:hypothetical protein